MEGGLILRLRPNEKVLVNGVILENGDRRARLRVKTQNANILRFRDAMHPDEADTPAKRLYYVAQLAVAGESDPQDARTQLMEGIADLQNAFGECTCRDDLSLAMLQAEEGRFYHVMRTLNRIIPHEATLLMVANVNNLNNEREEGAA